MEHLRPLFNEALAQEGSVYVEKGRVYIRNNHWSPDEILKGLLENDAEKEVFLDWIEERKADMMAAADEILRNTGQGDRFLKLSEAFQRGAVTPFVGAGLSIPSGYPGWTAFLRQQREHTLLAEDAFEALLQHGEYEDAAQRLADCLRAGFNEAVENAYGCTRELAGCVQYLPYVFNTSVITTNFDDVLKRSYENAGNAFTETLSGNDAVELARILGEGRRILLKLHGTSTTPRGRILTTSEYDRQYGDAGGLQRVVAAICTRTLLFMGCSLSSDRTVTAIKAHVAANGHDNIPRHYASLPEPGTPEAKAERRDQLLDCNIYPIWYPADAHDESVEAFLTKLAESA